MCDLYCNDCTLENFSDTYWAMFFKNSSISIYLELTAFSRILSIYPNKIRKCLTVP